MGKSSANTEDRKQMSDVAMARDYVADIGGRGSVKAMLGNAYQRLTDMFPRSGWTERRVRAFWNMDAAGVRFSEMLELHKAAEKAKAEQALIAQARKDHAAFIAKTAAIRAFLEHQDEDFSRSSVAGLGRVSGDLDSARDRTDRP
jgi:hypothetical protein